MEETVELTLYEILSRMAMDQPESMIFDKFKGETGIDFDEDSVIEEWEYYCSHLIEICLENDEEQMGYTLVMALINAMLIGFMTACDIFEDRIVEEPKD